MNKDERQKIILDEEYRKKKLFLGGVNVGMMFFCVVCLWALTLVPFITYSHVLFETNFENDMALLGWLGTFVGFTTLGFITLAGAKRGDKNLSRLEKKYGRRS